MKPHEIPKNYCHFSVSLKTDPFKVTEHSFMLLLALAERCYTVFSRAITIYRPVNFTSLTGPATGNLPLG